MSSVRRLSVNFLTLLVFSAWLCGCPAMAPQGGGAPSAAVGEPVGAGGEESGNGASEGPGPEIAAAEEKPHPGGVSAPGVEYGGESKIRSVLRGKAGPCRQSGQPFGNVTFSALKYRLKAQVVVVQSDGAEGSPLADCFGRFLRLIEGEGDEVKCETLLFKPDCSIEEETLRHPLKSSYYFSEYVLNIVKPKPHPPCAPVGENDPDFRPLKAEIDYQAPEPVPSCDEPVRSRSVPEGLGNKFQLAD